jgi:serine/threonine-protein kinase
MLHLAKIQCAASMLAVDANGQSHACELGTPDRDRDPATPPLSPGTPYAAPMDEWFVWAPGGETVGPVSTSLLLRGIRSGKVPVDALVCRRGEKTWRPIPEAPELAAAVPGTQAFRGAAAEARYGVKTLLGQGGMGEVYLCADEWIGREVAMKVAHQAQADQPHLRARFVREALVQGQLEHPSIVPVYDLGARPDGTAFFTMKRVRGLTLGQIIAGLQKDDPEIVRAYSRRRLLTAMSSVCLAVSFAHSRGVVHRDLKPANVMLGDFGEVYVLDWGVARVLEEAWTQGGASVAAAGPVGSTQAGAMVGTPGYAAPEQVQGDRRVGEAADVYALGAILFEILSLSPLHVGDTVEAVIASTLVPTRASASARAPEREVGPELDRIVADATAHAPEERLRSARAMHEAIELHLDGEKSAEVRRELARRHMKQAAEVFAAAENGGKTSEAERTRGLRELGAALALDPSNAEVLRTMLGFVFDGPEELPPEAEAELRAHEHRDRAKGARDGMLTYGFLAVGAPVLLSMPLLRPGLFALLACTVAATAAYNFWMWRTGNAGPRYMARLVPMAFLVVGLTSSLFGPFVMVPGTAAVTAASLLVNLRANAPTRMATLVLGLAAVLVPMALQLAGLAPRSYVFEQGSIRIVSDLVEFRPVPALALLATGSVVTVVATVFAVSRAVETLVKSERRNFAQAWRLRQMLPGATAGAPRRG